MRAGDFKLVCDYDGGRPALYNLVKDPAETNNIATEYPGKVKKMMTQVTHWYQKMPELEKEE